jgi:hypothetical protein
MPFDLVMHATESVLLADRCQSTLPGEILGVPGYSSPRVRHLLNNLCRFPACRYLEVGSWQGATILSASYRNPGGFLAIDNFSEFGGPREEFLANRGRWRADCRFEHLDADCWTVAPRQVGPVNVYFYDGGHAEEDQYRAFSHFEPAFTDPFIAVVDDWNWDRVRFGTQRAFSALGFQSLALWQLWSPVQSNLDGWWNGLLVAVVSKRQDRPKSVGGA